MQNKKSQREKTPQNHSAQPKGQDDNKVHYPLLSGCDLKRGIGIVSETAGVFTPLANGIRDLSNVTQYMSGTTDNRESIPSAHSQTIAFEITLTAYPNKPESRTVVEQWRGALCTALLYPVLFTSKDMLVWRKGILPDDNLFVDLLKRCRGSYALELDALCVQKKGRTYPILYCSEQCGVVPAAYGIESDLCRLPWLKPRKTAADISPDSIQLLFFTDPLPYLSLGQLRLLLRGLQSVAELRPFGASVALDEFINDVKDSILFPYPQQPLRRSRGESFMRAHAAQHAGLGASYCPAPSSFDIRKSETADLPHYAELMPRKQSDRSAGATNRRIFG